MEIEGWLVTSLSDGLLSFKRLAVGREEEWRLAAGRLIVRRSNWFAGSEATFFDAAFRMTRSYGGTSTFDLYVVSGKRRTLLYSGRFDNVTRRIALELAERTGWAVETEVW